MSVTPSEGVPAPPVGSVPPESLSPSDEVAARFMAAIKEAISIVPDFVPKHRENQHFVKRYIGFGDDLITSAIGAVNESSELGGLKKLDVSTARDRFQFMLSFKPAIDMVVNLGMDLQFTSDFRKAELIAQSLQTYAIAKGIGRDPSSANVAAHAANMKRDLRKSAKRKVKTPPPTPATTPDPKQN